MRPFQFNHSQNSKGFTLLELVVVIVLIGFLSLIILNRVWKYRVYAEEAAVTATIGNIRSSLGLEVAKLVVRGQTSNIASLETSNPMMLLAQRPHNYIGEIESNQNIKETGIWYFDKTDKTLNYIVNFPEIFKSNVHGIPRTRHQIKVIYTDRNKNNRFDKNIDEINGLDLVALEPYQWDIKNNN